MVQAEALVRTGAVSKAVEFVAQKGNSLFLFDFTRKDVAPVFLILMVKESNQLDQI
jgi:ribosomal protein S12 methylthiotransferase accessory factor YcaO